MKRYMKCCAFAISKSCIFTISEILLKILTSLVRTIRTVRWPLRYYLTLAILEGLSFNVRLKMSVLYELCYYIKESMQMGVKLKVS